MSETYTLYTTRYVMEVGPPEGMYFVEFWEMIGDGIAISRGLWTLRPIPDGWHVDWMGGIMPDECSGWEFPGFHDDDNHDDDWWRRPPTRHPPGGMR